MLGKMGQFKQAFLEFFGFLRVSVQLLELLAVSDLVFQSSLHDIFADFLNAINEKRLQLTPFCADIYPLTDHFLSSSFLFVNNVSQITDGICVTSLKLLHVFKDFILNVLGAHARLENQLDEFGELSVFGRGDVSIPAFRLG